MNIDNEAINKAAFRCDNDPSEESLSELLDLMAPLVDRMAYKLSQRTGIESTVFISELREAVWKASVGYNGESNFTQRFNFFAKDKITDIKKALGRQKRSLCTEVSMDNEIPGACGETFASIIEDKENYEDTVIETLHYEKMLAGFATTNEQQARILELLRLGFSNEEIAAFFGEKEYSQKARQAVSRAKKAFREYIAFIDAFAQLQVRILTNFGG
ncbi:sigma-70 family RNA polymerase sigma factor [Heliobacterium chlorum]|uniref:Sigma-70 family RNA polymerase sigma factor n=1 Tax=Heliobacterium chlorum TaxID=2698 RepID=A0ABR7T6L1_HELCL|nr:sigma-70 family RNA polymerase sigma factor [Heliobacterium chlorum]MBC9786395.1 sigma-70 family RNA polymerase sigma factor [Heliobacterium chlorum]